jgi:hypothetical protein
VANVNNGGRRCKSKAERASVYDGILEEPLPEERFCLKHTTEWTSDRKAIGHWEASAELGMDTLQSRPSVRITNASSIDQTAYDWYT